MRNNANELMIDGLTVLERNERLGLVVGVYYF